MVILTQTETGSPLEVFQLPVFENVLSIFITAAMLRLLQGLILFIVSWDELLCQPSNLNIVKKKAGLLLYFAVMLDIALNFKAYHSFKLSNMLRLSLKLVIAVAWVIALPICYVHSWENPTGIIKVIKDWLRETGKIPSLYITVVIIYLLPNVLGAVLFLLPSLRTKIEKSNWKIFQFLLWWSQVSFLHCHYFYSQKFILIPTTS